MYFTLEINEQLANALRAAAELKAEIAKVIKEEQSTSLNRLVLTDIIDIDDKIGDIMSRIGEFMGMLLVDKAFDEVNKISDNNNKIS